LENRVDHHAINRGKRYRPVAIVLLAGCLALTCVRATAQPLMSVLGPSPATKGLAKVDATAVKARLVRPDLVALDEIARLDLDTRQKTRFNIDLFPGLDVEAETVGAERRADGVTLFARLTGFELGSAVFTITNGVMTATVDFPGGSFVVTPGADGLHKVAQTSADLFPAELSPRAAFAVKRADANAEFTSKVAPADSGRLIDVMIVWTPAAQSAAGGLAAMNSLAQAAVDSANAAYRNSGIAQRLRLVHGQQVAYTERTSCPAGGSVFDCALDDLTDFGDGQLENVHTLRDLHGADLVALLIDDYAYCGLAWLPSTPSSSLGFSVTAHHCAVGNKSFAHELGHNMGAHHDPANARGGGGPKPFNKGYISPQSDWRTVMSYGAPCGNCTRINYFSNPKLTFNGSALGTTAVSNNAHVLNFTGKPIAEYRATSPLHAVPQRFGDVSTSHPLYGYIEFLAQSEMTAGCGPNQFCPDSSVTRRQMAAFIERAMRSSNWTPASGNTTFIDVVDGSLFAGHIEAMRTDGITTGCGPTHYCPESVVSNGQMAVFILRARCGASYSPSLPGTQTFADVPHSHPFAAFIEKAYALGIAGNCATGPLRYCPESPMTRGQMAAFIERAYPFVTPSEACAL